MQYRNIVSALTGDKTASKVDHSGNPAVAVTNVLLYCRRFVLQSFVSPNTISLPFSLLPLLSLLTSPSLCLPPFLYPQTPVSPLCYSCTPLFLHLPPLIFVTPSSPLFLIPFPSLPPTLSLSLSLFAIFYICTHPLFPLLLSHSSIYSIYVILPSLSLLILSLPPFSLSPLPSLSPHLIPSLSPSSCLYHPSSTSFSHTYLFPHSE